ncbi:MAG: hypothetical protein FJ288_08455 [Planctomycetes bacterium]|nr:hypothetical protein [Planctomycetota bacterium]
MRLPLREVRAAGQETRRAVAAAAAIALAAILLAGCGPTRGPAAPAAEPLRLAPAEVIARHNAWADSVQHIWSRAAVRLVIPRDDGGNGRDRYDMDGHLFLAKPDRLFLHGQVLGQEVFKLGMNQERFWLWIRPKVNAVWTGRRGEAGERQFILAPADLAAALGVFRIDLEPQTPAALEAQPGAYVLTLQRRAAGGVLPARRTWLDRRTLRPRRIDLFDEAGAPAVMAELLAYERIGEIDVCTTYRIRFYGEEEVGLVLFLSAVRLDKKLPEAVFEYRVPPEARVEDLDARAGQSAE